MTLPLLAGALALMLHAPGDSTRAPRKRAAAPVAPASAAAAPLPVLVAPMLVEPAGAGRAVRLPKLAPPTVVPAALRVLDSAVVVDSIEVDKGLRLLSLYSKGKMVRGMFIALGQNPVGQKMRAGDNRTPEGVYRIDYRNPFSKYNLALHVSYPNADDIARARQAGVSPGGSIMIHGLPKKFHHYGPDHRLTDWTNGCIAVTDEEIEEIFSRVAIGTPIVIKP